jgi:dTDP-4-dehydrorhamnose 3,5-epimerase-like enzyme
MGTDFVNVFKFINDHTKPGRILSSVKIGEMYMTRMVVNPGVLTGNKYHKHTQVMAFVERGNIEAIFENINTKERRKIQIKTGTQAIHIPNCVAHSMRNVGTDQAVVLFFTDKRLRSGDDYEYQLN